MTTIPQGWEVKRLADVGNCINGLTYSPDDVVDYNGILVLRSSNIQGNKLAFDDNVYVRSDMRIKDRVQANDILICVRNGSKALIGKNALISEEAQGQAHGAFMTVFRTKNYKYIFQLFQSDMYTAQVEKNLGATINSINNSDLLMFQFPMPVSLAEQQKIAEILSGIDRAIEATQTLIDKEKMIKKGLMADLLNHGIDEQGHIRTPQTHRYIESPLGIIPEGWEVKRFNEAKIQLIDGDRGANYPSDADFATSGFCLFLNAKNVTKNGFKFETTQFITEEKDNQLRKGKLQKEDIVLTTRGTVGNIAYFDEKIRFSDMRINSGMLILRHKTHLFTPFFYHQLKSFLFDQQIEKIVFGSAQPQLTVKEVEKFFMKIPLFEEQQKIAQILSAQDRKIVTEEANLAKLQNLKKALMNDLLSGKVRVK